MPGENEIELRLILRDELSRQFDQVKGKLQGGFTSLQAGIVTFNQALSLARQAVHALGEAWDFAKAGAAMNEQRDALDRLASHYGATADSMLAEMRRASDGMVSDAQLIQDAISGLNVGFSPQQINQLMEFATVLEDIDPAGRSVSQIFQELSMSVARFNDRSLTGLGIMIDQKQVFEDYAKTLGTTAEKLTEAEKRQAFLNAMLAEGKIKTAELGGETLSTADKMTALETALANAKSSAASAFAEFLAGIGVIDALASAANRATAAFRDMGRMANWAADAARSAARSSGATEGILNAPSAREGIGGLAASYLVGQIPGALNQAASDLGIRPTAPRAEPPATPRAATGGGGGGGTETDLYEQALLNAMARDANLINERMAAIQSLQDYWNEEQRTREESEFQDRLNLGQANNEQLLALDDAGHMAALDSLNEYFDMRMSTVEQRSQQELELTSYYQGLMQQGWGSAFQFIGDALSQVATNNREAWTMMGIGIMSSIGRIGIAIATEAGWRALMEHANALAAAASFPIPNPAGIAQSVAHEAAAAQYAVIAGVAGAAGVAMTVGASVLTANRPGGGGGSGPGSQSGLAPIGTPGDNAERRQPTVQIIFRGDAASAASILYPEINAILRAEGQAPQQVMQNARVSTGPNGEQMIVYGDS